MLGWSGPTRHGRGGPWPTIRLCPDLAYSKIEGRSHRERRRPAPVAEVRDEHRYTARIARPKIGFGPFHAGNLARRQPVDITVAGRVGLPLAWRCVAGQHEGFHRRSRQARACGDVPTRTGGVVVVGAPGCWHSPLSKPVAAGSRRGPKSRAGGRSGRPARGFGRQLASRLSHEATQTGRAGRRWQHDTISRRYF